MNLALKGWLRKGDHVITTGWEHHAVARPLEAMKKDMGIQVEYIPSGTEGPVDLKRLESAVQSHTRLIVSTHASNINGVLIPIEKIGEIAKKKGVPLLVDAAQTAGMVPIDVESMGISMLAFPGHKGLLGPQGTGGLYVAPDLPLQPLIYGGTGSRSEDFQQPEERPGAFESGTLNTPGIAGLGAGIQFVLEKGINEIHRYESLLTQYLVDGLKRLEKVRVFNSEYPSVSVVSFTVDGVEPLEVAMILDEHYEIAVRAGYHCAALAHQTMGTDQHGTVRVSPGYFNTKEDLDQLFEALDEIVKAFSGL